MGIFGYCLVVIGCFIWGFINGRKSKSEEFLRDTNFGKRKFYNFTDKELNQLYFILSIYHYIPFVEDLLIYIKSELKERNIDPVIKNDTDIILTELIYENCKSNKYLHKEKRKNLQIIHFLEEVSEVKRYGSKYKYNIQIVLIDKLNRKYGNIISDQSIDFIYGISENYVNNMIYIFQNQNHIINKELKLRRKNEHEKKIKN